eukprot:TRINITY_DN38625_c0_g1_i1.p1 TRINITY_DN38625_c0_g1~~TRINITY_DN38625_c0_g1_i1.p1  ORF type:complete len:191 (-),score=33.24 TRINITY_DN38625_c0_g1_i1:784-1356(-)
MGWRPVQQAFKNWKILRGDRVMVMAGKDKGQTGLVSRVLRDKNAVVVEGLNLLKKHVKKTDTQPGGIITFESPLHVSNVSLLDPNTSAPCRVSIARSESDGSRIRVVKGGSPGAPRVEIPRPEILKTRSVARPAKDGAKDTGSADAHALTWNPVTGEGGLPPLVHHNGKWRIDWGFLNKDTTAARGSPRT